MIRVTHNIWIDENEIDESFVQASGPGGQNVNKVATAVRLRFNVADSTNLPPTVKRRLLTSGDQRMTQDGVLVVTSQRYRGQRQNRDDALEKLVDILRQATHRPKHRVKTKPTRGSKERRLDSKRKRSAVKSKRGAIKDYD